MEPGAWSLNRKSFIWIDHEAAETTKPVIFPIEEGVMGSVSLIEGGGGTPNPFERQRRPE